MDDSPVTKCDSGRAGRRAIGLWRRFRRVRRLQSNGGVKIEQRLRRLMRTIRALQARRKGASPNQAISDLRKIGDWLCQSGGKGDLIKRRPTDLERQLSVLATDIYRRRKTESRTRLCVRLHPMRKFLGRSLYPNQILLHPEVCRHPEEFVHTLVHELAHHTCGIDHDHDEVFRLEMTALLVLYGKRVRRTLMRSL